MVNNDNAATTGRLPVNYGVIVFPGFQALDVFGPLDALNVLSWSHHMNLSIISETLDPVTTQVKPAYNPKHSNFGQSVVPTHTFATAPHLDVLLIPGGLGTREPLESTIKYVRKVFPSLKYLITVCTGAGIAARAGVLDDKHATTNKKAWADTIALGPDVRWISHARWVEDGNIWTSSGVSAGIDVLFAFMEKVYGKEITTDVANGLEYKRHTDPSWDPFADLYGL